MIHTDISQLNFANSGAENFWEGLLTKTFNLQMIENGQYRSRALAYFINYLDVNFQMAIYKQFPAWGMRLPFYILAAFMLVYSIYKALRTIFSEWEKSVCFMIASTMLFFVNYQVSTYIYLRSAKLMVPSVAIFMILQLKKIHTTTNSTSYKSILKNCLYGVLFFVLMTLDEQVIIVSLFCVAISGLYAVLNKKLNEPLVQFVTSCFLYFLWNQYIGRYVFKFFTHDFNSTHYHTIRGVFREFNFNFLYQGYKIYLHVIQNILGNRTLAVTIVIGALFLFLNQIIQKKKINRQTTLLSLLFFILSYIIITVSNIAHPSIFALKDLYDGMYMLFPALSFLFGLLLLLRCFLMSNKSYQHIVALIFFLIFTYNLKQTDFFHKRHTEYGHLGKQTPTEQDIILILKQLGKL